MKALTKKQLVALKATIKGFAAESRDIRRKYINPSSGEDRMRAWSMKRGLGHYARTHLLAYGLMRGFDREALEKVTNKNKVFYYEDWHLNSLAKDIINVCRYYGGYRVHWFRELTEDAIKSWLRGEPNTLFEREEKDPTKLRLASLTSKGKKRKAG